MNPCPRIKQTKVKSLRQLKTELDKWFSLFIRLRDSNKGGIGKCITCGRIGHYKTMDCGHFIKRQYLSTRWDEKNCNMQCKHCNAFEQGANEKYAVALEEKYGTGTVQMLQIKKNNKVHMNKFIYEYLIDEYKEKVTALLSSKKL